MMPDPNSLTSGTPAAPTDADLLYASAVRVLAADRIAELTDQPTSRVQCIILAWQYGLHRREVTRLITCSHEQARRAAITGQVPR